MGEDTETLDADQQTRDFLNAFLPELKRRFGERLWFCGIQGSRVRKENTKASDVDMVVILDTLDMSDIAGYRQILESLPDGHLACGFLAGKEELFSWDPTELFRFCRDTVPLMGTLEKVAELADRSSAIRAVWSGCCGIYHGVVHNMIYERSWQILEALYKSAFFVMSVLSYLRTGVYRGTIAELTEIAMEEERTILETYQMLRASDPVSFDETVSFDEASCALFDWSKRTLLLFPDETPDFPEAV